MTKHPIATPYTLRGIQQMLGVSRGVVSGLIRAGFVTPARGPRNEYRFSFQDVVLLRTAYALQAAQIAPRKIVRSLQRLAASLPESLPLTGLRITAVGNDSYVYNQIESGAPGGGAGISTSIIAPSVLLEELELKRPTGTQQKPMPQRKIARLSGSAAPTR